MHSHYNQNYTYDEIEKVLFNIKDSISQEKYTISMNDNRLKNQQFTDEYHISHESIKIILKTIRVEDFCYSLQNKKEGYEHETLYVFAPKVVLYNSNGQKEVVKIYIKINIIKKPYGTYTIVVSFHKTNRPVHYLFKEEKTK